MEMETGHISPGTWIALFTIGPTVNSRITFVPAIKMTIKPIHSSASPGQVRGCAK